MRGVGVGDASGCRAIPDDPGTQGRECLNGTSGSTVLEVRMSCGRRAHYPDTDLVPVTEHIAQPPGGGPGGSDGPAEVRSALPDLRRQAREDRVGHGQYQSELVGQRASAKHDPGGRVSVLPLDQRNAPLRRALGRCEPRFPLQGIFGEMDFGDRGLEDRWERWCRADLGEPLVDL